MFDRRFAYIKTSIYTQWSYTQYLGDWIEGYAVMILNDHLCKGERFTLPPNLAGKDAQPVDAENKKGASATGLAVFVVVVSSSCSIL